MPEWDWEKLDEELSKMRASLERLEKSGGLSEPYAVSYETAAQRLSVSTKTIQRMVKVGQLLTVIIGGKKKIPTSELRRVTTPEAPEQGRVPRRRSGPYDAKVEAAKLRDRIAKRR